MLKVLLCGRGIYSVIREFLVSHLDAQDDFEVHDHCAPDGLPGLVEDIAPDVVLLIVGVPGKDDVTNIAAVRRRYPECPIVAVSLSLHPDYAIGPLRDAGADLIVPAEDALNLPQVLRVLAAEGLKSCQVP
jgi:DNA-binding NarL/FixJ family response regulator